MNDFSQWIGRSQQSQDRITASGVRRYCATIGLDPSIIEASNVAPFGYHWCLCLPDAPMNELGTDGHPKKGGFLPPIALPRRMWASSNVEFFTQLPIGSTISRTSTIISVNEKHGKSGALAFVDVEHITEVDGVSAIKERQTIVYREAATSASPLPANEAEKPSGWQIIEQVLPTTPLLFRYSALTFNSHRIHYDLPYAQEQELYPSLVVHGPLIASLLLTVAAKRGQLTQFSFRAQSAAFCDQRLYLAANYKDESGELAAIGADGRTCVVANVVY